ncbi:hypothetical protein HWV62_33649 [Athelia sp. TMB]|nr:hypothetical protein HWV62_33649 [Athelia sp. TMB]
MHNEASSTVSFLQVWNTVGTSGGTVNNINGNLIIQGDYIELVGHTRQGACNVTSGDLLQLTPLNFQELNDVLRRQLKPANMDTSGRLVCLPGTRVDVLKLIQSWADDTPFSESVLWLHGLAGSGKTTIAATLAQRYRESCQLGAFLAFDRGIDERKDPELVIRTIAFQMGTVDHRIGRLISESFAERPSLLSSSLQYQFKTLLAPLRPVVTEVVGDSCIFIVLDALDECGTHDTRESLLKLLVDNMPNLSPHIRLVITSRKEPDIDFVFGKHTRVHQMELDLTSNMSIQDIAFYLRHHLARIAHKRGLVGWPSEIVIQRLIIRANGLFIWAATAIKFIDGYHPKKQLHLLLRGNLAQGAESGIDALYRAALAACGHWEEAAFVDDFQAILGMILVARIPLSTAAIDDLAGTGQGAGQYWQPSAEIVNQLGSVLTSVPQVRIIHPSFADFLTTIERCLCTKFFISRPAHNAALASRCLLHLDGTLKHNICGLTFILPMAWDSVVLSESMTYACLYWCDHICSMNLCDEVVVGHLIRFLEKHLLHWFEAMSLLRRSRETVAMLARLLIWIKVSIFLPNAQYMILIEASAQDFIPSDARLVELVEDACRFSQIFGSCIEEHPLSVYLTALPLSPTGSEIYRNYHNSDSLPTMIVAGRSGRSWPPLLSTIADFPQHSEWTLAAISPDRTRIVSATRYGRICVWDASSGGQTLRLQDRMPIGASGDDLLVVFSPDGTRIAAALTIGFQVWDAASGDVRFPAVQDHCAVITALNFSGDGTRIITASSDTSIHMWDAGSGVQMLPVITNCGVRAGLIALSPDGSKIIAGTVEGTVRVWDSNTGQLLLSHHDGWRTPYSSLAISRDRNHIISGCRCGAVRMTDIVSGVSRDLPKPEHPGRVTCVAFSSDGTHFVSGSNDGSIRVTSAVSEMETFRIMRAHAGGVHSVAFSPDGNRVISGGKIDGLIHTWDLNGESDLKAPQDGVCPQTVVLDHLSFAAGDSLLDAIPECDSRLPLQGLRRIVALSPDGTRLARVFLLADSTWVIVLWDTFSGAQLRPVLQASTQRMSPHVMCFSPDNAHIAAISPSGGPLQVWDTQSGAATLFHGTGDGDEAYGSLFFSLGGTEISARSIKGTIVTWDVRTGAVLRKHMDASRGRGVLHPRTGRLLLKLPDYIKPSSQVALFWPDESTLKVAFRTNIGELVIINIPPSMLTETMSGFRGRSRIADKGSCARSSVNG